jgi:pimeloyl-ACP methyl ester carboxylesterase
VTEPTRTIRLHGHDLVYREAGRGPVLLLVHGMASSSRTWQRVMPALAEGATVLAPDLLGHGDSAKDHTDHSLGNLATSLRDLLVATGHERATIVGHSLGGGIAMQFAYQFPERTERLILVGSGGLGKEVAFLLRALAVPGIEYVVPPVFTPRFARAGAKMTSWLDRLGLPKAGAIEEMYESYASLTDTDTRRSFFRVLRSVVGASGQLVSAIDRLYLAAHMPTLIVWGERDGIIPVTHAHEAHAAMPGSRLEILPKVGHFPQRECPPEFAEIVLDFLATTEPASVTGAELRELLAHADVVSART